jgi:hypothetical protein
LCRDPANRRNDGDPNGPVPSMINRMKEIPEKNETLMNADSADWR